MSWGERFKRLVIAFTEVIDFAVTNIERIGRLALYAFGLFILLKAVGFLNNADQTAKDLVKALQTVVEFKLYQDGSARSDVDLVSEKDIERIVKDTFSKELIKELDKQDAKFAEVHTAIASLNIDVQNALGASIDTNQHWYSDEKIDILSHRDNTNEEYRWDYTLRQNFKVTSFKVETDLEKKINQYFIKIEDLDYGSDIPVLQYETKLNEDMFIRDRFEKTWGLTVGGAVDFDFHPKLKLGVDYKKWTLYGQYDFREISRSQIGIDYHFKLF